MLAWIENLGLDMVKSKLLVLAGYSIILIHQGCRFDPQSGYIQESTNECINKWNDKPMFLPLSRKSINGKKIPNC